MAAVCWRVARRDFRGRGDPALLRRRCETLAPASLAPVPPAPLALAPTSEAERLGRRARCSRYRRGERRADDYGEGKDTTEPSRAHRPAWPSPRLVRGNMTLSLLSSTSALAMGQRQASGAATCSLGFLPARNPPCSP